MVDRAEFPKVKLCSGWLSPPVWDTLQLSPHDYPGGRWEWHTCHVRYQGEDRAVKSHGWFIRRFEFDDYLLRQCGADLHLGIPVSSIERDRDGLWSVAGLRAFHLVGAGGTHCPVARLISPVRPMGPVGVQEHEFRADPDKIAQTRLGKDGEPELLLHDDLGGYSWNVPKTDWLNIGSGTLHAKNVRPAWEKARAYFQAAGHVPTGMEAQLDAMKGYSYYLYHPEHLKRAAQMNPHAQGGAFLIGDSLGLAHPVTAEGILPAVTSGRVLAEAILDEDAANYPQRLARHPVIADYQRVFRVREAAALFRKKGSPQSTKPNGKTENGFVTNHARKWVAWGFGWLFSGKALPTPQLIDWVLTGTEMWLRPKTKEHP
jgi:flavin-dependent dehydrogenase